ncbi:MAG TPA: hypothetical protein VFV50_03140 [Bdellovibrionales bacterium]|nr:hypothetical protein [Bdellovibrionales bacterium]
MMNDFRKLLPMALTAGLLAVSLGCARDRAPGQDRTFGPQGGNNGPNTPLDIPVLKNALQTTPVSACSRLEEMRGRARESDLGFAFLREVHPKDKSFTGALDISESPFAQLYFGEKFVLDTPEEFLKKVEAEYQAGNISELEYRTIQAAKLIPSLLRTLQYKATNDKIAEAFPGVFGETGPMDKALFWLLTNKAAPGAFKLNDHAKLVTARVPLFTSADWSEFSEDQRLSLSGVVSSVLAPANTIDGINEKLCGLVLWQRAFAQLLALKGYTQPEMVKNEVNGTIIKKKLLKLSSSNEGFKKSPRPGAFIEAKAGTSVIFDSAELAAYDPAKKLMRIAAQVPAGGTQKQAGTLDDTLALMEGLTYMYAATSPAAPWVKKSDDYVVGDMTSTSTKHLLPHDVHSLALGLLRVNLKNLAALHVIQTNDKGAELAAGEKAAGFIPVEARDKGVSLSHVIRLTRIAVYLDQALEYFSANSPETWQKLHPLYDRKTLAALIGETMFSKDELAKLLTPAELEQILNATLVKFRLPLASLLLQMATGPKCVSHLEWDLKTGSRKPTRFCDQAEAKDARAALRLLAQHIRSPLLFQKAGKD